jgi:hypothetical protein
VARGRPRSQEHIQEIAEHLARGKPQQWIAEHLGVSHTVIWRRIETMRIVLAEEHEDGGLWLNKDARSPVEVALAWLARDVETDA